MTRTARTTAVGARDDRPGPAFAVADLKRAFERFRKDRITDFAAGLTYYSLLSLFPALLCGVAVLGFFGQEGLVGDAARFLKDAGAPRETVDAVVAALQSARESRGTALTALALGLATALYGASGAFGAVGRALNVVWRVEEGRGFVKRRAQDVMWTIAVGALVLVTCVLVFLGGGLSEFVFDRIGLGDASSAAWRFARWPAAVGSMTLIYAILYYAAPNVEIRRFQWITPGAVFGVVAWILASIGFFVYVSKFGAYSATYGAFAAVVILLVWLWLSNLVLLFGAELNAVIDLRRTRYLPPNYDGPPLPAKEPAEA